MEKGGESLPFLCRWISPNPNFRVDYSSMEKAFDKIIVTSVFFVIMAMVTMTLERMF